jgi:hypothetical protein
MMFWAGIAAITISMNATAAEQGTTGMVTGINRLNSTVAIKRIQTGTVEDAAMIEDVHAGDRVTFSTTDSGDTKTITKIDRQR